MVREFIITNENGLHARPATSLVQKANQFNSDITITYEGNGVDLKSIMGVLSLGITRGALVSIRIEGPDEVEAMQVVSQFLTQLNLK